MAFTISYTYQVIDKFTGPLKKINKAAEQFRASMRRNASNVRRFSNAMSRAGGSIDSAMRGMSGTQQINKLCSEMRKLKAELKAAKDKLNELKKTTQESGDKSKDSAKKTNLLSRALARIKGSAKKAEAGLSNASSKMASFSSVAGGLIAGLGGKAAMDTFVRFDKQMRVLQSTKLDATAEQMKALRDQAKKNGRCYKIFSNRSR